MPSIEALQATTLMSKHGARISPRHEAQASDGLALRRQRARRTARIAAAVAIAFFLISILQMVWLQHGTAATAHEDAAGAAASAAPPVATNY